MRAAAMVQRREPGDEAALAVPAPTPLWVALGLALGPAAVLGFGRFAYALLLPPMRADLGWSYAEAGTVNAANAAGYLVGALLAARTAERLGAGRSFALGLVATGAALLASALTRDFAVLLALRVAAGIFGAVVFVAGGSLAARAGLAGGAGRAALLLAVYFAGPGLGILLSGPLVAAIMGPAAADWPAGWIALGTAALLAALLSAPALRRVPAHPVHAQADADFRIRPLAPIFVTYTLFGAGYIAYMTFIVAFLRTQGLGEGQIAVFWAILGAAAIPAAFVWGRALARLPAGGGVFAVMATVLAGAVLPLMASGPAAAFGSAALFGGSFPRGGHRRHPGRPRGDAAGRLDAGDRRAHHRVRARPVPGSGAGGRALRRAERPARRHAAVGAAAGGGRALRVGPAVVSATCQAPATPRPSPGASATFSVS
jgi:MFS family permease